MVSKREQKSKNSGVSNNGAHHTQGERADISNKIPRDEGGVTRTIEFFEKCLDEVFESRREFYLSTISEKISALTGSIVGSKAGEAADGASTWVEIESLSRLRAIVGGRFQNIRN